MSLPSGHQLIIDKLYDLYELKGFIREKEALDLMSAQDVSLQDTQRITDTLLGLGVIFADDSDLDTDNDFDYTQTDYESIFQEVLQISPEQELLVNFMRSIRPPQRREWNTLIPQAQAGNSYAYNRLFEMYLRVVIKIALSLYKSSGYELDDLIQEGCIGLTRAIRVYDVSKHGYFASYLPLWISQFMNRAIADKSSPIRIPVHMQERINSLKKVSDNIEYTSGAVVTPRAIADAMGVEINEVKQILAARYEIVSFDEIKQVAEDGYVEHLSIDALIYSWLDEIEGNMLREQIDKLLSSLSEREQNVLKMRYGLDGSKECTLEQIGSIFGLTRERVRQIEEKALLKLRRPNKGKFLVDYL